MNVARTHAPPIEGDDEWAGQPLTEAIERDFEAPGALEGCTVLSAHYDRADYDGSAHVLYRDGRGVLWWVEAGHCSCYGLEGQWSPEPVEHALAVEWLRLRGAAVPDSLKEGEA